MGIINWLKLPELRHKDLSDKEITLIHKKIIQRKFFLRKIYFDFYSQFKKAIGGTENKLLVELGGGGGFIKEVIPNVITSDIICLPNLDKCFSALKMPFADKTVDAFLMIDVLHHFDDAKGFFREAERCLRPGGKIIMIEPANTLWGHFIYQNFHHEMFDPTADWNLAKGSPLYSANGALPWIIFFRDREIFEKEFPGLKIIELEFHTPFRYLISGGVSFRQLLPDFAYPFIKAAELILSPFNKFLGMFLTIEIEKDNL